jgi:ferrous-iron efflux pump FieF
MNASAANHRISRSDMARSHRLARMATYASVSIAVVLISIKSYAWFATESVAILSSLVDSLLDVAASLVTLFAVRRAQTPADQEHRFGHGKAEPLAALAQSAFIIGSAVLLLFEAASRLFHPQAVERPGLGMTIIAVSILLTLGLVLFQRRVVEMTGSIAISADSLHYRGDLLMNLAVMAAVALSGWLEWVYADPIFAVAVAFYIMFNAWRIVREALDMLMDRELPRQDRDRIYEIAGRHPEAFRAHDLKTRRSGHMLFIQLHLEMDPEISLIRAHQISDEVEAAICDAFPGAEVIIHQDPEGLDEGHPTYA